MATYTGTNDNEILTGTVDNDTFIPMLGFDTVVGGGGHDTLVIDYSGLPANASFSFKDGAGQTDVFPYGGGWSAELVYSGISTVLATLSDGDDTASVDVASAMASDGVTIEGGLGNDRLVLDFTGVGAIMLGLDALGNVSSIFGHYTGFEAYDITLAGGVNTVTLGAGDDKVTSNGGGDQIDGGAGTNTWIGHYDSVTANQTFTADGDTARASLSSVASATTLTNVTEGAITGGSGDDSFTLTNSRFSVYGGAGVDTLTGRFGGTTRTFGEGGAMLTVNYDATGFYGRLYDDANNLSEIERLDVVLGDEDNIAAVNLRSAPLANASLRLDGGLGINELQIDARPSDGTAITTVSLALAANGSITSNLGTFAHFTTFRLDLDGGNNTVTTRGGADVITVSAAARNVFSTGDGDDQVGTQGGTAAIDLGSGFDTWYGHSENDATGQTYAIDAAAGVIANSRIDGVERLQLTGSHDGADTYIVGSGITDGEITGFGNDTFIADFAGTLGATGASGYITTDASGVIRGGVSGLRETSDSISFDGMSKVSIRFNDSDNDFGVFGDGTGTLLSGDPKKMILDGGLGNDTITMFMDAAGFSIVKNGTGGYVVVDIDRTDAGGFVPEFTLVNFEHIHFKTGTSDTIVDLPAYGGAGVTTNGTTGSDTITGTEFADVLNGLGGNDTLIGLAGDDLLNGGVGDDKIDGGADNDTVTYSDALAGVRVNLNLATAQNTLGGGLDTLTSIENVTGSAFADTLTGNAQSNILIGLDGNDTLNGGAGADMLIGGLGNDTYTVDNSADVVIERPGEGTDTVNASASFVLGTDIERLNLTGSAALDGTGNASDNQINGNGAANHLLGLAGADTINAGNGADWIAGGLGADILTGGGGVDTFVFDVLETSANRDQIRDFDHGVDKIAIDHAVFGLVDALGGPIAANEFAIGKVATTATQHFIYNAANGQLFYDADGVGGAAQVQIAMLMGKPVLSASDFVVI
ncbi:beta strand repeat-containing protein [Novosphingobium sp.]|uniref:beta strand repeat-containing protein n=1 Tax=Novosphingobium sp. TaxID=1874826 RepID=UPI0038B80A70